MDASIRCVQGLRWERQSLGHRLLGRERVEGKDLGLGHVWAGLRVWVLVLPTRHREGEWHRACTGGTHFSRLWSSHAGARAAELWVVCLIPGLRVP